ncbi:MAG TPA: ABC transporter ATP-binding protein [Micromonosporaceae bacterium]
MSTGVAVRCVGVVQIYGDVVALRGVDLDVDPGEFVALLGPTGSGKSTLLGLLAGVLRPSAGRVLIGEHDMGRISTRALGRLRGRMVATVLQDPARNLLPYATVRQNVQFGAHGDTSVDALIEELALTDLAGRVAGRLSAGEQQRVAIATAVASGARLLLADEPTSQLDRAGRDEVIGLLEQINRDFGATVVLVTHDPEVAKRSTRTITIRDGRVGAEGRHGREYAVVGGDGAVPLPPDVLDAFPPGTLLEVRHQDGTITMTARPLDP